MRSSKKNILLVLSILLLDQISKLIAVNYLRPLRDISLIEGFLNLTYLENKGAAFGFLQGGRWIFVFLTSVIMVIIYYYYIKLPDIYEYPFNLIRLSLLFITGGALGNFIDRALNGYVVDFIHVTFIEFPVFNFADICVVIGSFSLAALLLFAVKEDDDLK